MIGVGRVNFLDRLVGVVLSVLSVVAAGFAFLVALGWNAIPVATDALATMGTRAWETGLSAIVLLLAALHLLAASLPKRAERAIVRETALGQVRVSLRAMENAVYRSVRVIKGVRDCDVRVSTGAGGVEIHVSISVAPDLVIPDLADEVQHNVERYIQDTVGIPVVSVAVEVRAVAVESKARVE